MGSRRDPRSGRHRRQRRGAGAQPPRRAQRAAAGDPRPLRPPRRPGRSGPVVALAAARCGRARDSQPAVARAEARSARRPRGHVHALQQRQRWRHVSGLDDVRRGAGAARRRARPGGRMGAAPDEHRLRARRAGRDGDDRAPGRLRRSRQHHTGRPARGRGVRDPRSQVVLLVSAVRRVPGARAGAGRAVVLPGRARTGDGVPAPEGQARHAFAAILGGRVPRHRGTAGRRGGARGPGDHPDGQPHAARLHARVDNRPAAGRARSDPPHAPPVGIRRTTRRPAGDAKRARRPRARVRGGDGHHDARCA